MIRQVAGFFSSLLLVASICPAQPASRPHYIEIKLPPGVPSESFFIRYVLAGQDLGA
jgi:hypothetical protein